MQLLSAAVATIALMNSVPSDAPTYAGLNQHRAQSMYEAAVAGMNGQTPHQLAATANEKRMREDMSGR